MRPGRVLAQRLPVRLLRRVHLPARLLGLAPHCRQLLAQRLHILIRQIGAPSCLICQAALLRCTLRCFIQLALQSTDLVNDGGRRRACRPLSLDTLLRIDAVFKILDALHDLLALAKGVDANKLPQHLVRELQQHAAVHRVVAELVAVLAEPDKVQPVEHLAGVPRARVALHHVLQNAAQARPCACVLPGLLVASCLRNAAGRLSGRLKIPSRLRASGPAGQARGTGGFLWSVFLRRPRIQAGICAAIVVAV
mmetsp:Transcript_24124/g.61842  ORF Transcript_24124/g.61842 Transcript_24124/m.61842 type:complete len:252 (+) Transcript_24124:1834-2589(+)